MANARSSKKKPASMEPDHLCRGLTSSGGHCTKSAGWGTNHVGAGRCRLHGGNAPSTEMAGQLILARREYQVMGIPIDISPIEALLECIRIAAGEVAYASNEISRLAPDEAVIPLVSVLERPMKGEYGAEMFEVAKETKTDNQPQLHIWIRVRQQAMDRLVAYSATAIKAGVDIALVKIAEQTAQLVATAIAGILKDLGVRDHPKAPEIVRHHLQILNASNSQRLTA